MPNIFSTLLSIEDSPLYFLFAHGETPTMYGLYHIICLLALAGLITFIILFRRNITEEARRRAFLVIWITVVLFELVKQFNHSYNLETGEWSYQWYIFPFQFCSSIFYVLPFAIFFKSEKIKSYAYSFLISYNLFAGLAVMLYPATIFTTVISINVQTVVHHGAMLIVAVLLLATKAIKLNYKTLLRATAVFAVLMATALILNGAFHDKDGFNMFYVNIAKAPCELPVIGMFSNLPLPVFLLIYIVGFMICAALMMLIFGSLFHLVTKKDERISLGD